MSGAPGELGFLNLIVAASPIIALLVLMIGFGWGADRAGPVVLALRLMVAFIWFGADTRLVALSQGKARGLGPRHHLGRALPLQRRQRGRRHRYHRTGPRALRYRPAFPDLASSGAFM